MRLLQFLILTMGFVLVANAQTPDASTELNGTVIDQLGAAIPATRLVLTNAGGKKFEALTGAEGDFRIQVPAGTYLLEVEYTKHGAWNKFKIEKYEVAATRQMKLDVCLSVNEEWTKKHGTTVTSP